jgi:hypothetical protein
MLNKIIGYGKIGAMEKKDPEEGSWANKEINTKKSKELKKLAKLQ